MPQLFAGPGTSRTFAQNPRPDGTDWTRPAFRNLVLIRTTSRAHLVATDRTKFYTSAAYANQEGIIYKQGLERFTGNANLTHKFGDFEVQVTKPISKVRQNKTNEADLLMMGLRLITAFFQRPLINPLYNEDGTLNNGCGVLESSLCMKENTALDVYTLMKAFNTSSWPHNIWDALNWEKIAYDYAQGTNDVLWDRHSNNGALVVSMQRIVNRNDQPEYTNPALFTSTLRSVQYWRPACFETQDTEYASTMVVPRLSGWFVLNWQMPVQQVPKPMDRAIAWLRSSDVPIITTQTDIISVPSYQNCHGSSRLARETAGEVSGRLSGAWRSIDESLRILPRVWLTDESSRVIMV